MRAREARGQKYLYFRAGSHAADINYGFDERFRPPRRCHYRAGQPADTPTAFSYFGILQRARRAGTPVIAVELLGTREAPRFCDAMISVLEIHLPPTYHR